MEPLKVLIVDDEPLARLRLRSLLASIDEPASQVLGEAASADEALVALREQRPEVGAEVGELARDAVVPCGIEKQHACSDEESEHLLRGFLSGELYREGLICRADDRGDPVIQLSPPLIADEQQFDAVVAAGR